MKEQDIIAGIKSGDNQVLSYLYKEYFPMIHKLVKSNNGSTEDAQDVFQEGIVIIFKKFSDTSFILNHKLKTFLYAVCKNIWLVRLRTKSRESLGVEGHVEQLESDQEILKDIYKNERLILCRKHFNKLGEDCQKLLELYFLKIPVAEIKKKLGISSENYVRKRKHVCKEQLIKSIKSDRLYNDFLGDDTSNLSLVN